MAKKKSADEKRTTVVTSRVMRERAEGERDDEGQSFIRSKVLSGTGGADTATARTSGRASAKRARGKKRATKKTASVAAESTTTD